MTTLDADTLLYYRRITGVSATITDPMIQSAYDRSVLLDDDTAIIKALTCVDMLQQEWGLALKKIDVRGEVESESRAVIFDRIKQMIEYWSGEAGINGVGMMSTSELTLNLNYSTEDITNTWP